MISLWRVFLLSSTLLLSTTLFADTNQPIIRDFGKFYLVPDHQAISAKTTFKIAFDVADGADQGKLNYQINSLARFINMHVAHGVKPENIELALVVHGGATLDLLSHTDYRQRFGVDNASLPLLEQLLENNTQVFVCGQSAMHHNVSIEALIPGVKMALSAMTAHAQLQQQGFSLNPF